MADLLAGVGGVVLSTVDDEKELADHLHAILADPVRQRALSATARQAFLERFQLVDWVARVVRWLESTVVAVPPPRRRLLSRSSST
jgi:hypothetical protein